ncbi:MAG: hypothetical protein FJX68_09375 [Alphaproteobacteria bacterium]|nr:hypothetical protein [Alphaproteobacteria bacterium]
MATPATQAPDRQLIQAYGDGGFRVSGLRHQGAILVLPWRTLRWPAVSFEVIDAAWLVAALREEPKPDLLLLGCGPAARPAASGLRQSLRSTGLALETMDTGAACRTYNVLLLEERRVAAALLPV